MFIFIRAFQDTSIIFPGILLPPVRLSVHSVIQKNQKPAVEVVAVADVAAGGAIPVLSAGVKAKVVIDCEGVDSFKLPTLPLGPVLAFRRQIPGNSQKHQLQLSCWFC